MLVHHAMRRDYYWLKEQTDVLSPFLVGLKLGAFSLFNEDLSVGLDVGGRGGMYDGDVVEGGLVLPIVAYELDEEVRAGSVKSAAAYGVMHPSAGRCDAFPTLPAPPGREFPRLYLKTCTRRACQAGQEVSQRVVLRRGVCSVSLGAPNYVILE